MRIFLVLMILANLGFFGWQTWMRIQAESDPVVISATAAGSNQTATEQAATLVLVSELTADQSSQNAAAPAQARQLLSANNATAPAAPGAVVNAGQALVADNAGNAGDAGNADAGNVLALAEVDAPLDVVAALSTMQPATQSTTNPDAGLAAPLTNDSTNVTQAPSAASQAPVQATQASAADSAATADSTVTSGQAATIARVEAGAMVPAGGGICTVVDNIAAQPLRDQLIMLLDEENIVSIVTSREVPVSSTWWVHIPPFASDELAQRMLLELQGKSIDSYYMRTGELAGGISLGVFSRQESAISAQQGLERRGYKTDIREIMRMETLYAVLINQEIQALLAAPRVRLFLEANQGLEVSEIVCESVAQGSGFP